MPKMSTFFWIQRSFSRYKSTISGRIYSSRSINTENSQETCIFIGHYIVSLVGKVLVNILVNYDYLRLNAYKSKLVLLSYTLYLISNHLWMLQLIRFWFKQFIKQYLITLFCVF